MVHKTTDYKIFTHIVGNRQVNDTHVKALMESIRIKDMLADKPINVIQNEDKETFAILDGQHRLEAATRMGKAIYYTISETGGLNEVHLLQRQKLWTAKDYLESYITKGIKDYEILKNFVTNYQFSIAVALQLFKSETTSEHDESWENFRSGKFNADNLLQADERAKALIALKPYSDYEVWRTRNFIQAIKKVWEKVEPSVFLEKAKEKGDRFRRRATIRDYLKDFEDIANYKVKTNHVRFY
ncbi:MAG: ParB N-terminal domain-containing protein [Sulfurovaceae bacterium]|nr:ParB N-terminal domain-containing protein [Sulfurovaceae bacterium]